MFSCEFCEIFENTFLTEHLRVIASDNFSEVANFDSISYSLLSIIMFLISFSLLEILIIYSPGLLLKLGPGPWTQTLKNLGPEKHGKQLDREK